MEAAAGTAAEAELAVVVVAAWPEMALMPPLLTTGYTTTREREHRHPILYQNQWSI